MLQSSKWTLSSMATEPLEPADKENAEKLPVNVRLLTDKRHVIVRLDQLQRGMLKDPQLFDRIDNDRSLNHLRGEVNRLKEALTAYAQQQVNYEYTQLQHTLKLMVSWAAEEELNDVLALDRSRYEDLQVKHHQCEVYPDYVELLPHLQAERERLYHKYSGFFQNRAEELKRKREETQKKLKPCQPKMEESRQRMEAFTSVQQQINYYGYRSTRALVGGMGALIGLTFVGFVSGIWGGWFWGALMGYIVFSNIATLYTDIRDKPMLELYAFLKDHYEIKNLKPFFSFDNKEKPEEPTRFDAARGEALARFMQKDVQAAANEFAQWERQHTEHVGYLQYLEGQRAWSDDQLRRITLLSKDRFPELLLESTPKVELKAAEPAALIPVPVETVSEMPAPPEPPRPVAQDFEKIPEPPVVEAKPVSVTRPAVRKNVRPSKLPDKAS
jgi:hypothetical protein